MGRKGAILKGNIIFRLGYLLRGAGAGFLQCRVPLLWVGVVMERVHVADHLTGALPEKSRLVD